MSGIPPQLEPLPQTPAGEWAVKTTSALEPEPMTVANASTLNPTTAQMFEEKNMRPGTIAQEPLVSQASAVSTPGHEFPGAYPNRAETQPAGSEIMSSMTETANRFAQSVNQTAQTYAPIAAEKIGQYLPKSMADKMSEYTGLPNPQGTVIASEHDIAHAKSLPSTELNGAGAGEHVAGVGALPGSLAETSVTKLPEERNTSAEYPTMAGAAVIAKEKAQGAAQTVQGTAQDAKDRVIGNTHSTAVTGSTLPSRELDGAQPGDHSSGIGALPGSINERGVAVLPDEGGRGITGATSSSVGTHSKTFGGATLPSQDDHNAGGMFGGVGALPGQKDESRVALLPDERGPTGSSGSTGNPFKKDAEFAGAGAASAGMGKWALDDKNAHSQSTSAAQPGLHPKTGEDSAMADAARAEGVKSADSQPKAPVTKQEKKQEGKAGAAAVGAAVGEKVAKDENAKDEKKEKKPEHESPSGKANQGGAYDTDYHPSQLHPLQADYSKEHAEQEKEKEPAGEKQQEKTAADDGKQQEGDHDSHGQKAKKVGFMTKMKGEAKILLGKVEGKKGHEKVEEGQKIKAGEATSPTH